MQFSKLSDLYTKTLDLLTFFGIR